MPVKYIDNEIYPRHIKYKINIVICINIFFFHLFMDILLRLIQIETLKMKVYMKKSRRIYDDKEKARRNCKKYFLIQLL